MLVKQRRIDEILDRHPGRVEQKNPIWQTVPISYAHAQHTVQHLDRQLITNAASKLELKNADRLGTFLDLQAERDARRQNDLDIFAMVERTVEEDVEIAVELINNFPFKTINPQNTNIAQQTDDHNLTWRNDSQHNLNILNIGKITIKIHPQIPTEQFELNTNLHPPQNLIS